MDANVEQAKGKVEQAIGDLTGDDELKRQGKADETAGKVKGAMKDVEEKAEGIVDSVKDAFNKD